MKKSLTHGGWALTTLGCVLLLAVSARGQDMVRYRARPSTNTFVRINGSANVHDWEMEGILIGGYLEVPSAVVLDSAQGPLAGAADGKLKASAEVSIPVTSIVNAKYDGMSQVMQDAMDAKDYPRIVFHVTEMTLKEPHAAGTPLQFDTKGEVTVHGVTNKIAFPVSIETVDKAHLKISAQDIPMKIPDYNVKPPVKMGIFITAPDIKISFEWLVGLTASPAKPAK